MLSLRARVPGLTIPDVHRAIDERAVVVTWINRGTIHLMRPDDMPWLPPLTAPTQQTAIARRFAEHGFGLDAANRAVAVIDRALADEGPLKREDLRDRVTAAGFMAGGGGLVPLLFYASYRGVIVRGPVVGRQHHFVRTADCLGKQPRVDRDKAL